MVKTVLHIDDDHLFRKIVSGRLQKLGYTVYSAQDGADGVAKAQELNPDLVLTDIDMPNMDGYAATAKLRQLRYAGIIVALTGSERVRDVANAVLAGCDDFISKPLDDGFEAQFTKVIQRQAERHAANDDDDPLENALFED